MKLDATLDRVVAALPGGGEARPGQRRMAEAVALAIDDKRHLVVQAGTGTGKSLAYLVPAILSGKRTVIATATKALQEQLCVDPGTRILTADLRHVRADELSVGEHLVGFDEERDGTRRRYKDSVVLGVAELERPCYEVEFDDGTVVVCSSEHRWLCGQSMEVKWLTTERLAVSTGGRPGSKVIRLADVWPEDRSWDAGYLAGLYDREGCLQQRVSSPPGGDFNSLTFSQVENETLRMGCAALDRYGIEHSTAVRRRTSVMHQPCHIVRISNRSDLLRVLGQFRPARLLAKFDSDLLGTIPGRRGGQVNGTRVVRKTFLGLRRVIAIETSTRTYIAEGLASHNCGKDLPFLAAHIGRPVTYALLKGRSNYLCRQRALEVTGEAQLGLDGIAEMAPREEIAKIVGWATTTTTGDRADLPFEPSARAWNALTVTARECPGASRCPVGDVCFCEQARDAAAEASIVVVNTHLYGMHLASGGVVLPEHDVVVFDEAHQLEDIIADTAGADVGPGRFSHLARVAKAILKDDALLGEIDAVGDILGRALVDVVGERLRDGPTEAISVAFEIGRSRIDRLLAALRNIDAKDEGDVKTRVLRATSLASTLALDIAIATELPVGRVAWVEGPAMSPSLRVAPIDVSATLATTLWPKVTAILTSATIPAGLRTRVGLPPEESDVLDVGSPFDYETNSLLYCATHLPDPRQPGHVGALCDELAALITAAGGRTLALFTSWRVMKAAFEAVQPVLEKAGIPVLAQGDRPKSALMAEFSADEATSLFATMSFWQGIDVPGRALSLVTVDRLPFPRPDEPLMQARREQARAAAFSTIDLPRAATLLAQGAGRLIRTATDRGVVAVLDPRLATANYRWDVINALPPMRRTKDRAEVERFLRAITAD